MLRDLVLHPDKRLRRVSDPVTRVTPQVQSLMDDLIETMLHDDRGIGLAAPQIGVAERVIAIGDTFARTRPQDPARTLVMANPEIVWASEDTRLHAEGCMSIPNMFADVTRPAQVHVRYLDRNGETQTLEADDLLAIVLQHEIDHLNGVLFIDHLSSLKRDMLLRRYHRMLKAEGIAVD